MMLTVRWRGCSVPGCLLAVVLACCCQHSLGQRVLRVAQLGDFSPYPAASSPYQFAFKDFAVPYINANSTIQLAGETWTIEVVDYDLQNDAANVDAAVTAAANGLDMAGNAVGDIHVIAAATSSKNAPIIAAAQTAMIPQLHMSGGNPAMWDARNTFAFGMHLPFIWYTRDPIRIAALRGMRSIMIIRTTRHGFSRLSCIAALQWAMENNLEVVGPTPAWCRANINGTTQCRVVTGANGEERCSCGDQADVDGYGLGYDIEEVTTFYEMNEDLIGNGFAGNTVDADTTEFVRGMFRDAAGQGKVPDVVLNFAHEGENVLQAMYLEDFVPKMTLGWQSGTLTNWAAAPDADGTSPGMTEQHGYWAVGFGQWHKALVYSDPVFGSNAQAVELWQSQTGTELGYNEAGAISTAIVLYKALGSYVSESFASYTVEEQRNELRLAIGSMNDETMWGVIRFNRFNQNNGRGTAAWQIVPDANKVPHQLCVLPAEAREVELVIPFPTWESRFGCPAGTFNTLSQCDPCAAGTFKASVGPGLEVTTCDTCQPGVGTLPDATGATGCSACPDGRSNEGSSGICAACPEGKYRNGTMSECEYCPPGTHTSDPTGSSSCVPCELGTFAQFRGSSMCDSCAAGAFADSEGSSECSLCTVGRYTDAVGRTVCSFCGEGKEHPELWGTLQQIQGTSGAMEWVQFQGAKNQSSCGCSAGAHLVGDQCVECIRGMVCKGMDDVSLVPGFYAVAETPGFVFRCYEQEKRCPGGVPGTCAPGRNPDSIACVECLPDMKQAEDGTCNPCGGAAMLPFAIAVVLAVTALGCIYWVVDHENQAKQSNSMLLVAVSCGQLITMFQQMGVISMISLDWPAPFNGMLDLALIFNFDLDILHIECITRIDPVSTYFFRVFCVFIFFGIMIAIHLSYVTVMHKMHFVARMPALIGSTGAIFMAFFISIVSSITAPFQCNPNPNGLYTMRAYMTVVCWEHDTHADHKDMVTLAALAVLIPVSFLAACTWVVLKFPDAVRRGNTAFLHAYAFLLFRFRPEVHWYAVVFLVRNALVAFTPVLTSPVAQITFMQMILMPCMMLTVYMQPWKVQLANLVDACASAGVMIVLCMGAFAVDRDDYDPNVVATLCCIAFSMAILGVVLAVVYGSWERYLRSGKPYEYFICHHKAGAGNLARLLKMQLLDEPGVKKKVFVDSDDLGDLNMLFSYVGHDTDTLVVLCSREIYSRPWCVGEMTTAKANGVKVTPVILTDFERPSETFLTTYATHVPDVKLLSKYGMSLEDVEAAIRWMIQLPSIQFEAKMDPFAMQKCVDQLLSKTELIERRLSNMSGRLSQSSVDNKNAVAMVVDRSSAEAMCAAMALHWLLTRLYGQSLSKVPVILGEKDTLQRDTKQVLLICSNGVFKSPVVVNFLKAALETGPFVLPVISEAGFRFPTSTFYKETYASQYAALRAAPNSNGNGESANNNATKAHTYGHKEASKEALTLVKIIKRVFTEIAIEFNPQDKEDVLDVRASAIINRLAVAAGTLTLEDQEDVHSEMLDDDLRSV